MHFGAAVNASIRYDAADFWRLSRAFAKLPQEIRATVASRAMRRVADMGRTQVVKRLVERIDVPSGIVRERTSAFERAGEAVIAVRSSWIPLYKLGARQTRSGVTVMMRGSYRSAFIAKMGSGHVGVFRRDGKARLPISELFGPNPANDVATSPDVYRELVTQVAETHVLPRMLHELARALPR